MSKIITDYVASFEALTFDFKNQRKRMTVLGFMPQQCNANSERDDEGIERSWFQVVGLYESSYDRKDENGQVFEGDNSTIKTLVAKFKSEHLRKYGVSTSMLKEYLEKEYIGKRMLILPCTEEKISRKTVNKQSVLLPNQTEVTVLPDFDLWKFCGFSDKSALETKKA